MAASLFFLPFPTAFTSNGLAAPGAKLYFYESGSLVPTPSYTTESLTIEHPWPVVANGAGRFESVYLDDTVEYRLVIKDRDGTTLDDIDPYIPGSVSIGDINFFGSITGAAVSTSRALLAALPGAGSVYVTEAGHEGWFTWDGANNSANVTADPNQALYVPPTSDTDGSSGAWVRDDVNSVYRGTWFGYKGDGTDDTAAIQAIFDYLGDNGGGEVIFPPGTAIIGGAFQDVAASNAQLVLPKITDFNDIITIKLRGTVPPFTGDPNAGTIWESTLTGEGNLIGVRTTNGVSCINLVMDDIILRTPQASSMTALNLNYVHYCDLNIRVDVPDALTGVDAASTSFVLDEPVDIENVGIRFPLNSISALSRVRMAVVVGYYHGIRTCELVFGNFIISACKYAADFEAGEHANNMDMLITNCQNTFFVAGPCEHHGVWTIEHDTAGASGPAWVEDGTWGVDAFDIDDPGHALRGSADVHMHDFTIPFAVNGAKNFKVRLNVNPADVFDAGLIFPSIMGSTNMSSSHTIRGMFGLAPWLIFLTTQASTTGTVGAASWANGGTGHADVRLAEILIECDGETDRGIMKIGVGRDGTLGNALWIPNTNHLIPKVLPDAADDAAAAALTPPVPLGGLYRTGGAVKVRLA